jgi:hypothetical protein
MIEWKIRAIGLCPYEAGLMIKFGDYWDYQALALLF